jgi:hypothetical protein
MPVLNQCSAKSGPNSAYVDPDSAKPGSIGTANP